MATSKLNAEDFKNLENSAKGVLLVYTSQDGKKTAQQFLGAEYEPVDKSQNEIFRVWKNVLITFWAVKKEELKRIQGQSGSTKVSMVYLNMVQEAQNVVSFTANLLKVSRKFQKE